MQQYYADGYPIVIDWYYTEDSVKAIDDGFKAIVNKYALIDHYDNLLFLSLGKIQEIEAILYELNFQYAQKKRTKELAELLLAFGESSLNQYHGILLKTLTKTAKITDKKIIHWIGTLISEGVKKGNLPLTDFEYSIMDAFYVDSENGKDLSIEKLKMEASKTVHAPKKQERSLYADFCFYLYNYLIKETEIKPNSEVLVSDTQLNFYFDLLELFGFIDSSKIGSENKDYLSSLLRNRLKSLHPHYQGNKMD
ncbi:MAG TPA: hypothetical protein VK668_10355 [Mucilaginibacter sp.]|nr:hypothetical protein [Mucilaginibacter sp.]